MATKQSKRSARKVRRRKRRPTNPSKRFRKTKRKKFATLRGSKKRVKLRVKKVSKRDSVHALPPEAIALSALLMQPLHPITATPRVATAAKYLLGQGSSTGIGLGATSTDPTYTIPDLIAAYVETVRGAVGGARMASHARRFLQGRFDRASFTQKERILEYWLSVVFQEPPEDPGVVANPPPQSPRPKK